jgi:hypothetical protein
MVNVMCMKWGTKYAARYVQVLRSMVSRNLPLEHRFICMTDDATGLPNDIDILPLPELGVDPNAPERGWKKLSAFQPTLDNITGTTLFLDLDIVILDDLSPFFEYKGNFCIINDWKNSNDYVGNSSVFRFTIGEHNYILEDFLTDPAAVSSQYRNEQAYLSDAVRKHGELVYWPESWCVSFKKHCLPKVPLRFFREPTPPQGTKIVIFHGDPKPDEAARGLRAKGRAPYKPATWINDFWH